MAKRAAAKSAVLDSPAIELWPISRLKPYERNPRKNDGVIDRMVASIKEFGFKIPVLARSSGEVVDGHLRLKAAQRLNVREIPVILCDEWADAQVKAFRLLVNRSVAWADWDEELLKVELLDLQDTRFDLSLTGFDALELDNYLQEQSAAPVAGLTPDDAIPEPPQDPVTKRGDVWVMDKHRLMCGDCRDRMEVNALFAGHAANLVFTSPPYASQREYDASSGFRPIHPDEYVEWFEAVAKNVQSVMVSDASYFLNIKPPAEGLDTHLYVFDLVIAHVRRWGFHFATEFCWERNGVPKSVTRRFKNQFEPVYQFALDAWKMRPEAVRHESENVPRAGGSFGGAKKRKNGTTELMSTVQGTTAAPGEYIGPGLAYPGNRLPPLISTHQALGHAAAFPVGLPDFFIRAFTDERDVTFDPFMGSGSTLIASHKNNRVSFGMEISPTYCDVIVKRWEEFTGKQAVLENG